MSLFGILITYACAWWMVFFMVLPWRVKVAENPAPGLAASAPINPMIRKKMLATTILAIIPTLVLYIVVGEARAAEADIYHAGRGGCREHKNVAATDTVTQKNANNPLGEMGETHVGIDIPARDYTEDGGNPNLRHSDIYMGTVSVGQDGTAKYNGQTISEQPLDTGECK